ncbi:hypothetical protein EVAR_10251_1 [Eumeta japonica]|uniref:Uncharacterized protein n=1 Tax=Eumeta variegata TaxID=151549 RepID=A0A4C1TGM7_EUMVA|nr:hypothetical protein EVAR_10251_1 [Eumeta japonica]
MSTSTASKPQDNENIVSDIEMGLNETPKEAGKTSIGCQTDACDNGGECRREYFLVGTTKNEASTQTNIYIGKPNKTSES